MQNPIRVLLIEHQPLTRIGIKAVLDAEEDIDGVAEADRAANGFALFKELKPDVTILSLRMPDSCAIDDLESYFTEDRWQRSSCSRSMPVTRKSARL